MIRQSHLIAVVGVLLMECCSAGWLRRGTFGNPAGGTGTLSTREQGYTEATERETRSPDATTEKDRCEGTRTYQG